MSHELATSIQLLAVTCPPTLTGLIPGQEYRLGPYTQSSGAGQGLTFDVVATALSPTSLAVDVKVIPSFAASNVLGWPGIFDYATCQLSFLHDPFNNQVGGSGNIAAWPWIQQRATLAGNVVHPSGTVDIGPSPSKTVVNNVWGGNIAFSFIPDNAGSSFSDNQVDFSALTINATGPLSILGNEFDQAGTTNITGSFAFLSLVGSEFSAFTTNLIGNNAIFAMQECTFNGNITNTINITGQLGMNDNDIFGGIDWLQLGGQHNLTGNSILRGGTLQGQNIAAPNTHTRYNLIGPDGHIVLNGSSFVEFGYIGDGILTLPTGVSASRVSLRNANSTLVVNVANAQKVGYPGALP